MTLASIAPRRRRAWMLGLAAIVASLNPIGAAPRNVPGPLFGGAAALTTQVTAALDPSLPTGAPLRVGSPPQADATLCSPRHPLCVHSPAQHAALLRDALALLESAYRAVRGALSLPQPWATWVNPNFEVYLSDDPQITSARPASFTVSARTDRASLSCQVPLRKLDASEMVHCLGFGIANAQDAAETPALTQAYAAHLAWLTGALDSRDLAGLDDVQANPETTPIARSASGGAAGGALLLEALEQTWQHPKPGWVATTLLSLSRNESASTGSRWNNEPDWFDVLRYSFGESMSATADWLGTFAVDRALLSRYAANRLRNVPVAGDAARVRFDWRIAFSSLPRRVAISRPLQPLGTTYVWLDLDKVPNGSTLGFRADWEAPVAFKWILLSIDDQGREVGRLEVPYLETATSVERTWARFNAEGARAVVIAGVNLGAVDPAHPFDPDYEPWESHGCTVYLAKL